MTEHAVTEQAGSKPPRVTRELRTIEAMIGIYCRDHHSDDHDGAAGLCPECRGLLDYATCRLSRCPFGAEKPTCARCPIHCYKPQMRERVKAVMRYAGPRMIYRHPILAVMHKWDGWRRRASEGKRRKAGKGEGSGFRVQDSGAGREGVEESGTEGIQNTEYAIRNSEEGINTTQQPSEP